MTKNLDAVKEKPDKIDYIKLANVCMVRKKPYHK